MAAPTLQQLSYFVAAVEHGSFVAAAEAVHIAQPSLSEQVRRLERSLGVTLFVRTNRRLQLTEAGRVLLPQARRTLADAAALTESVRHIRELSGYDGVVGPLGFTDVGEPSQASFAIESFTEDDRIDEAAREFQLVGDPADATTDEGPAPAPSGSTGGPLVIGSLTPQTGSLSYQGPQQLVALQLAVDDVNAAGGVLGQPVQLLTGDSGDASTDIATQTADRMLQSGVNVIVGASSSGVSLTVIDKIVGAGVAMISPASTSDELTDYEDRGLFFRTVPPDTLQARALADLILANGNNSVGILALNDPYGVGLAENTRANLVEAGLAEEDVVSVVYDPQAANYDSEVQQMVELAPDGILVIGFEESSRIIEGLNAQGIGPQR